MRGKGRISTKAILSLESLDDRVLPSATVHAALAHGVVANHAAAQAKFTFSPKTATLPSQTALGGGALASRAHGTLRLVSVSAPSVTAPVVAPAALAAASSAAVTTTGTNAPNTDPSDVQNGPMANAGQDLIALYQSNGSNRSGTLAMIDVRGTDVNVNFHGKGDFKAFVASLQSIGVKVQNTDASSETVTGLIPIPNLLKAAQLTQTVSMSPVSRPVRR